MRELSLKLGLNLNIVRDSKMVNSRFKGSDGYSMK
jgi:hypothetical protein